MVPHIHRHFQGSFPELIIEMFLCCLNSRIKEQKFTKNSHSRVIKINHFHEIDKKFRVRDFAEK